MNDHTFTDSFIDLKRIGFTTTRVLLAKDVNFFGAGAGCSEPSRFMRRSTSRESLPSASSSASSLSGVSSLRVFSRATPVSE